MYHTIYFSSSKCTDIERLDLLNSCSPDLLLEAAADGLQGGTHFKALHKPHASDGMSKSGQK